MDDTLLIKATNMIMEKYAPPLESSLITPVTTVWANKLRNNYIEIKKEYLNFTSLIDPFSAKQSINELAEPDIFSKWDSIPLRIQNINTPFISLFPNTMKLVEESRASFVQISIMKPGAVLTSHCGCLKCVHRYHLCLIDDDKCSITLENTMKQYTWKEGYDVLFDDMVNHSVTHTGKNNRVVLFLDIPRITNIECVDSLTNAMNNLISNTSEPMLQNSYNLYLDTIFNEIKDTKFYNDIGFKIIKETLENNSKKEKVLSIIDFTDSGIITFITNAISLYYVKQKINIWQFNIKDVNKFNTRLTKWNLDTNINIVNRSSNNENAISIGNNSLIILHIDCNIYPISESINKFIKSVIKGGLIIIDNYTNNNKLEIPKNIYKNENTIFWIV